MRPGFDEIRADAATVRRAALRQGRDHVEAGDRVRDEVGAQRHEVDEVGGHPAIQQHAPTRRHPTLAT